MNGRRLLRQYAQSKGKEAVEFVGLEEEMYSYDTLVTKDKSGNTERTSINYKDLFHWIVKNVKEK